MKTVIDCAPGEFYELSGLYFLPTKVLPAQSVIDYGPRVPVSCMFDIHWAMQGEERVGFIFKSQFETTNTGTYLLTRLRNKGPATEVEVLVKDENLVVYHYPNIGTLATSPVVNSEIDTILTEQ